MAVMEITGTTGKDRQETLARWEREGKLKSYTVLGAYDDQDRRLKTRHFMVISSNRMSYAALATDGRKPFLTEEEFAQLALSIMALA